eukprot:14996274-Ditylum_brightwellii.AAC.1
MGMQVKLTYTLSANGNTAGMYVIISKLKESEMPSSIYPNGFDVEEILGLSAVSAIDSSVKVPGYIAFVRSGKNLTEDE